MSDLKTSLENRAVERLYAERRDFIIIGLTGRTGCGCTTVGKLLSKELKALQPPCPHRTDSISERSDKIIYDFSQNWKAFHLIEMKHVIFTFILDNPFDKLIEFVRQFGDTADLLSFEETYTKLHQERLRLKKIVADCTDIGENVPNDEDLYTFYFKTVPNEYGAFQKCFNHRGTYTKVFQKIGNNIRASGQAFSSEIYPDNILKLAQRVNLLIKILRRRNLETRGQVLVAIDAFRNPYEATFFKDRYSAFYLFAINTIDSERRNRLVKQGLSYKEITDLDKEEYPSLNNTIQDFYKINIEKTIELADIHINNPDSESLSLSETKRQLIRYISLIMHPGLVPPTPIEYCMQAAYDSKLNSGCLSRQVGAVISDENYNIIATGWNSVPEGQIPCSLRSLESLVRDDYEDTDGMSVFERTDTEFKDFLRTKTASVNFDLLHGRNCAYCFKDAYNAFTGKKNQVHTRAIHAEEMAFLQAAKIGNPPVKGGCLFTTASPCELCSKKAYHTGIKKIYYIDQYPGISYKHILSCGKYAPEMIPFSGAIGRAYTQLYTQIIPYKEELYMLLGLTFKKEKNESEKDKS